MLQRLGCLEVRYASYRYSGALCLLESPLIEGAGLFRVMRLQLRGHVPL